MDPNTTNLIQPPLPAVLPLHHEIDTVRQCGQNPGCRGLECNSFTLEVYAIDSFGSQGLEHCTKEDCWLKQMLPVLKRTMFTIMFTPVGIQARMTPTSFNTTVSCLFNHIKRWWNYIWNNVIIIPHVFLCRYCYAETHRSECWGTPLHRPPWLKTTQNVLTTEKTIR